MLIYTIGHSNYPINVFLKLLTDNQIQNVIDIRSFPNSRWSPQFNRKNLSEVLIGSGILYEYLGDLLGGYPPDPTCYKSPLPSNKRLKDYPEVDYAQVARRSWYQQGIQKLVALGADKISVILCAEEDPLKCHRHLLITPSLTELGINVVHMRGDGALQPVLL
jgi:uncharacterized protein (DUF488 family)